MSVRAQPADAAGIDELRAEMAGLIGWAIVGAIVAALALSLVVDAARRPALLLVLAALGATFAIARVEPLGQVVRSLALAIGLGASAIAAVLLFPGRGFEVLLVVSILTSGTLLGPRWSLVFGAAAAIAVGLLRHEGVLASELLGSTLVLVAATTFLSAVVSRPTVRALEWAWHSYELMLDRAEALRDRQGELGRLTKSLNETVLRLEQINAELARARRAADEARQLKADFAAIVSHELRTPLNLIIGFGEMLIDPRRGPSRELPPALRPGLEVILRNARHISRLVDDILDLSQIDAHRMALEKRRVAIRQIVDDAVGAVAALYEHLGLSLEVDLPDDLPAIQADGDRIRQVIVNLLNNAARFTERGGVSLRARRDGHDLIVAVRDSGGGIAGEDLPHVFDSFRQVGSGARRLGGSGLGLTVCKQFAEMHGGHMWAESDLGSGSTFYLSLPIGQDVVSEPHVRAPATRGGAERAVVVIAPEHQTGKVFERYLDGYQVLWARSIAVARRLVASRPVNAAVVTSQAGLEAWQRAQRRVDALRQLPTYVCQLTSPRRLADELGVEEYLLKPVSRDQLGAAIRRHGRDASDVLIIEDDPEMAQLLGSFVAAAAPRARLRAASDGAQGWAMVRERRPDLILLDLQMPRMAGREVIAAIRGDSSLRETPVVVITGRASRDEAVRADALLLSRPDGFSVGETMRCLQASLDALLSPPAAGSGSGPSADLVA